MLRIIPNKNNIGAEIDTNIKKLSKENFKIINNALNTYGMIFFRRQNLSSKHYVEFAKNFGKLADYPRLKGLNKKYPHTFELLLRPFWTSFHSEQGSK